MGAVAASEHAARRTKHSTRRDRRAEFSQEARLPSAADAMAAPWRPGHGSEKSQSQPWMPFRAEKTDSVLGVVLVMDRCELSLTPAYWLPTSLAF